ncbi:hypothetical protein K8R33_00215 [archaeon]|nr:hypothetical protein [archaeon]
MKRLILIDSTEVKKRVSSIKAKNLFPIALDFETKEILKNNNIPFKSINEFMENNTHLKSMHWLKDWSEKKIFQDKSFKDLIKYKDISLWWFIDFWLYYHPIHKDTVYEITLYLETIKNILNQETPEVIYLATENKTLIDVTKLLFKKSKVLKKPSKLKTNYPYIIEYLKEKKFLIRNIISKLVKNKKNKDLLFFTYPSSIELIGNHYRDRFLGAIVDDITLKTSYVDIDYDPNPGISGTLKRRKDYIPFESFHNQKVSKIVRKEKKKFEKIWRILEKQPSFKKSFTFEGINLYPLLKKKIKFIFTNRFPETVKYIETSFNLLKKTKPKAIVLVDETSMYCRSVITAARILDIKSIGMSHGLINKTCFEYIHNKNEVNPYSKNMKLCPIPDHTMVFGECTKDLLINQGQYPKESIEIVGQPRYDFLANKKKFPRNDKNKIFEILNLDKTKKLVSFYSEYLSDVEAGDLPYAIFNAIKELNNSVNFVVKLHPREYEKHQYFYENLAKKTGIKVKVIKNIDIFELINASDIGIVMHSNTGMETVMLNKPLLMINVTNKEDVLPYAQEKVALSAYKTEEIAPKIKELLFNENTKQRLLSNRDKFISHRLFKLDGKSGERARKFIEKTIK